MMLNFRQLEPLKGFTKEKFVCILGNGSKHGLDPQSEHARTLVNFLGWTETLLRKLEGRNFVPPKPDSAPSL